MITIKELAQELGVSEQAPAEEQTQQEPAEDPPQQKLSFWQRLFRKDKNRKESR